MRINRILTAFVILMLSMSMTSFAYVSANSRQELPRQTQGLRPGAKHSQQNITPGVSACSYDFSRPTVLFHRNRYYNPQVGRFTSQDPIGFNGGYNLFAYANQNPLRWVDPWGLDPIAGDLLYYPNPQNPSRYFVYTLGMDGSVNYVAGGDLYPQDIDQMAEAEAIRRRVPAGMSPSDMDDYLKRFFVKVGLLHVAGQCFDEALGLDGPSKLLTQPSTPDSRHPEPVRVADFAPTHGQTMSNSKFRRFLQQIGQEGIREPIKYVEVNGQKYIVDGHHRALAAQKLGIKYIPAEKVQLPYKGYISTKDLFDYHVGRGR